MNFRVLSALLAILLIASSPILHVVRAGSDEDSAAAEVVEDIGIVGDETQVPDEANYGPAPGVNTVCIFPKNSAKLIAAGEESQLLVGLHNEGESAVQVIAIYSTLHLPFDHRMLVQNLTVQQFVNASVPLSAQATFPYTFAVSKFLQPGSFDLVGSILYEIDQQPFVTVFYNGTVEVIESGGFLSGESFFLLALGAGLLAFLGFWLNGQIKNLSKKTKKTQKVEVGTRDIDGNMDEWLQGTAYESSVKQQGKKKK